MEFKIESEKQRRGFNKTYSIKNPDQIKSGPRTGPDHSGPAVRATMIAYTRKLFYQVSFLLVVHYNFVQKDLVRQVKAWFG